MRRVVLGFGVAVLAVVALVLSGYNRLVTGEQGVAQQWGQVETQFQRRFDLIPNLVRTAKGYMEHEKGIFEEIAKARQAYLQAKGRDAKQEAQGAVEGALGRLMAIVENYPVLKANEAMQQLMDELAGTENRVSVERMRFNRAIAEYNLKVKRFPTNVTARLFGFEEKAYFVAEKEAARVPHVSFE